MMDEMDRNRNKVHLLCRQFEVLDRNKESYKRPLEVARSVKNRCDEEIEKYDLKLRPGVKDNKICKETGSLSVAKERLDGIKTRRNGMYFDSNTLGEIEITSDESCGNESSDKERDSPTASSESSGPSSNNSYGNNEMIQDDSNKELKAPTPTSSISSCGSAAYGRIKRSNAFRQKDVTALSATSLAPESRQSNVNKLVLERVKSLEIPGKVSFSESQSKASVMSAKPCGMAQRAASVCIRPTSEGSNKIDKYCRIASKTEGHCANINGSCNVRNNNNNSVKKSSKANLISDVSSRRHAEIVYSSGAIAKSIEKDAVVGEVPSPKSSSDYEPCPPLKESTYGYVRYATNSQVQNSKMSRKVESKPFEKPPEKPPRTFLYDILCDREKGVKNTLMMSNKSDYVNTKAHVAMDVTNTVKSRSSKFSSNNCYKSSDIQDGLSNEAIYNTALGAKMSLRGGDIRSLSTKSDIHTKMNGREQAVASVHVPTIGAVQNESSPTKGLMAIPSNKKSSPSNKLLLKKSPYGTTKGAPLIVHKNSKKSESDPKERSMNEKFNVIKMPNHPPLVRSKTESHLLVNRSNILGSSGYLHPMKIGMDFQVHGSGVDGNSSESLNESPYSSGFYSRAHFHHAQNKLLSHINPFGGQYRSSSNLFHLVRNNQTMNTGVNNNGASLRVQADTATIYDNSGESYSPNQYSSTVKLNERTEECLLMENGLPNPNEATKSYLNDKYGKLVINKSFLKALEINNNGNLSASSSKYKINDNDKLSERCKSDWSLNVYKNYGLSIDDGSNYVPMCSEPSSMKSQNHSMSPSLGRRANPSRELSGNDINLNKDMRPGVHQSIQNLVNQLFSAASASHGGQPRKDGGNGFLESTDSGIQLGSGSLSSCDTPAGDSTTDTGDSDCDFETDACTRQIVEARKDYVQRVSSFRAHELGASINRLIQTTQSLKNSEPLFECIIIIGLNRDPYSGVYHPYVRETFPQDTELASGIEKFCFPDSLEWPCHEGATAQFYTLAITDQKGSRKYGCCYRILPEGANMCIPITYCLISSHRAIGFFKEVLRELTSRHGTSDAHKQYWLNELYKRSFPSPGEGIVVQELSHLRDNDFDTYSNFENDYFSNAFSLQGMLKNVTVKRKTDSRLDERELVTLLTTLDLTTIMKIFGSLLLERKVVLVGRALSVLSLCVEALESMLYPFSWQHTFVPILPLNMTDVLDAPAPFLIGVLRSTQSPWNKSLDEGIVVDLDNNKILSCVGDEASILPKRISRKLKDALYLVMNLADQKDSTKNVLISECFIRMFVETLGHHSQCLRGQIDGKKTFDRECFIKYCDSKATQNFLEWFSETSLFHAFTESKLTNSTKPGIFDQRVVEQSEQTHHVGTGGASALKNAKLFMKGTKPFGTWFKDTFAAK